MAYASCFNPPVRGDAAYHAIVDLLEHEAEEKLLRERLLQTLGLNNLRPRTRSWITNGKRAESAMWFRKERHRKSIGVMYHPRTFNFPKKRRYGNRRIMRFLRR